MAKKVTTCIFLWFSNLHLNVSRSLVDQHVGPVKTEVSRKLMPIDEYVARDLLAWYAITRYKGSGDYVWATDANRAGADGAGYLHRGPESAQAGCPEQGCGYDTAEGECIFCVSR